MNDLATLPLPLQQRLNGELKPGERFVWSGQPVPARYMNSGFKAWYFFVPWTAFAAFWIASAADYQWPAFNSGWDFFPLGGLPFLLIGLAGLSTPFWLRRRARTMIYAISNLRAMTIEGANSFTVKSYHAKDIAEVVRTEHPDGSGDLVLRTEHYRDSDGDRQTRAQGFMAVARVREVERFIEKLRHAESA
ncbi:MAG: hypothetical protein Q8R10_15600 [Pseudomonas sp.]|uniref:hypothetical protein n=1 Tax=Pseudomonas sp. TaxID=306 RepID=UPI002734894E|nr:hypothetical protein [Pseudomonas sp.]MDP3847842.1 hypothetical protein [Pseudomonas sp.]